MQPSPGCGVLIAVAVLLYATGQEESVCVDKVIFSGEGLRVVLAPLTHSNWGYLAVSCLGLGVIGPHLERCYGTAGLLCILLVSATVSGCVYLLLSCLAEALALSKASCAGGLAVLFQTLLYIRTAYWEQRWCFGRLTVSSRTLPWVLLPLSALLTDSALYALAGLLVGILLKARVLSLLLPRYAGLEAFSRWRLMLLLRKYGCYLPVDARVEAHDCLSCASLSYSLAPT